MAGSNISKMGKRSRDALRTGASTTRRGRERASRIPPGHAFKMSTTSTPNNGRKRARSGVKGASTTTTQTLLHAKQRRVPLRHRNASGKDSRGWSRKGDTKMAMMQRIKRDAKPPAPSSTCSTYKPKPRSLKWQQPDIELSYASDGERERRRKKPRNAYQQLSQTASAIAMEEAKERKAMVFAVGPTRKSRALNRKKLSKKDKMRLKEDNKTTTAPAFSRGSSASVRKLLTLDLSSDLEADLTEFARFVSLTDDERGFRKRIFEEIKAMVRDVFPAAHVELYGSSSSGLETFRSDLDITVGNVNGDAPIQMASALLSDRSDEDNDGDVGAATSAFVFDTVGAIAGDDQSFDTEPSFSLNLSLPGMTSNVCSTQPQRTASSGGRPRMAASAPHKSPWNPTLRRQKMRQLRALQQILMDNRPQYKIKCLSKAKIPILMIEDKDTGLQIDLGVNRETFQSSDHGRTTTLVTELQLALGKPFISIVVFLKEFLHQFDLDKPFTGGLGSYRLYMMVAYIFTTRFPAPNPSKRKYQAKIAALSQPQTVSSAKALLTFLEVFSNRQKRGFFSATTELPVHHGALMDVVDFQAVFRLEDCIEKFAMAFDIISKKRNLGCVVFEETLQAERRECAKRILKFVEKEEQQRQLEEEEEPAEDDSSDDSDVQYYL